MKKPFVHIKEKILLCMLLAVLLLANIAAIRIGVASADKAKLYVDPPRIIDPTKLPPAQFTININVANVTNLYAYEFKLGYNTTILTGLGVIIVPFPDQTDFTSNWDLTDEEGFIWVNVTYYDPAEPLNTTDPVTLARIIFLVEGVGSTILDLYDTKLWDPEGNSIDHDVEDGYFDNRTPPKASFTYWPPAPLAGQIVTFNATASDDPDGYIASYYWNFGDGTNGTGMIVNHTYTAEGSYNVTLTVTDNHGSTNITWRIVNVGLAPPVARFTYSPETPLANRTVTFNASASDDPDGLIANFTWNFGDLNITTTTEEIINHTYAAEGSYNVTLTVTDNDGLTDTAWKTVRVGPPLAIPPVAIFDYSPVAPLVDETVTFNASASDDPDGNIASYDWYFGDRTIGTGPIVNHTYTAAGNYIVILIVTDNDGLTDACFKTVRVMVPPLTRIYVDPEKIGAAVGETFVINVMINVTDPPGAGTGLVGPQYKLFWNSTVLEAVEIQTHGDAVPGGDRLPGHTVVFVAMNKTGVWNEAGPRYGLDYHSYAFAATSFTETFRGVASLCTYTFQVVGNGSCALDIYDDILVDDTGEPPEGFDHITVDGYFSNLSPLALFTYSPKTPLVGEVVTLNATDSYDVPPGYIANFTWDFGDGAPAGTGKIVTHTYTAAGIHNVTLTVTDNDGLTDTAWKTVRVGRWPSAFFTYSPVAPPVNQIVTFNASASDDPDGYIASYYWNFGDGTNGTGMIVNHTYTDVRLYTVNLTVTDNDGLTDSAWADVSVTGYPEASFIYSPLYPVVNETITFNASDSYDPDGSIVSYQWDFGDGNITTTTEKTINHTYTAAGIYTVTLAVTDNDGLKSKPYKKTVKVTVPPTKVYVDPERIGAAVGETFVINVKIYNVTDLYGFEFKLGYNTTILDGVNVTLPPGHFLTPTDPTKMSVDKEVNDTIGRVWVSVSLLAPETPKNGSGILVTVTFKVMGNGSCFLDLYETKLVDPAAEEIPHCVEDGYFSNQFPIAYFTYSPLIPIVDAARNIFPVVTFDASASKDPDGWIVNYTWNFGDGSNITTTSDPVIIHKFAGKSGRTYTVTLNVTDNDGLTDTFIEAVKVYQRPRVTFLSYSPPIPLVGDVVTFDAKAIDTDGWIVNYTWNFGDLNITTTTEKTINHTYTAVGVYNVTLTVTDNDGLTATLSKTVGVGVPKAIFMYFPVTPLVNHTVTFDARESFDLDGWIVNYTWNFGDGTTETGKIVTHIYPANDTYTVTLTVTDNDGLTDIHLETIRVILPLPTRIYVDPEKIGAAVGETFVINVKIYNVTDLYGFQYKLKWDSTILEAVEIQTHSDDIPKGDLLPGWTKVFVGDNTTAPGYHSYAVSATGGVAFTDDVASLCTYTFYVVANGSCFLHLYDTILVDSTATQIPHSVGDGYFSNLSPLALFTYSPPIPLVDETVTFDASASFDVDGLIVNYAWNFGDLNITTTSDPVITHVYATTGTYTVTLIVTDNDKRTDTYTKTLRVHARTVGWIEGTVINAETLLPIVGASVEADGYSNITNASGYYKIEVPAPATYNVTASADGHSSQTVYNVFVNASVSVTEDFALESILVPPAASFTWSPLEPVVGEEVIFTSTSTDPDGTIVGWEWDFNGDGTIDATTENTTWTYTAAGTYNVTLKVTDKDGLTGTTTQFITVQEAPPPPPASPYTLYAVAVIAIVVLAATAIYYLKKKR